MTPIIEAVCNSIDSIGNLPNGTIDIMAIRDGQKSYEGNTSVSGSIIGFDIGLGSRVRTLPLGRDRWGKYSTKGGYILSLLRKERLGEKGGAFLNGKEGRVGFRKAPF